MKAGEIFKATMPYIWAKLLLGAATVGISLVILAILMGLSLLFSSSGVTLVFIAIWLGLTGLVRFLIMHYFGYLIKAGHIAVIAEAVVTGRVPENQVAYGKQMVTERFATANVYFVIDKLVTAAVKQVQRGIGKVGNALSFIPGVQALAGLAQFFVELSLGYVDECCLGYTFYRREQGAFKSAADGVVIYAQNWKRLLGGAAKTMAMIIGGMAGITLVLFVFLGLLFGAIGWSGWIAFAISLIMAFAVKFAFMDSFVLIRTMVDYMEVAPITVITFDLYDKLSKLSGKFKELFNKGQQEQPIGTQYAYAGAGVAPAPAYEYAQPAMQQQAPVQMQQTSVQMQQTSAQAQPPASANDDRPVFCTQCGAPSVRGVKFCGKCGKQMN